MKIYETNRLIIREWLEKDISEYIALNLDPEVLEYFPRLYEREESIDDINKFKKQHDTYGYTIFACELKIDQSFIGFVGLNNRFDMPFSPCVEIGWRLKRKYWGFGYASEAAKKCLELGFNEFNLTQIIAFTPCLNLKSIRVMQKIGLIKDESGSFHHYKLNKEHKLSPHVLYRINKLQYINHQKFNYVK